MRKFLVTVHHWLGLPLGVLFFITFGTGLLTAIDELLSRASFETWEYKDTPPTEKATMLDLLLTAHTSVRQVKMPSPDTPYYQVIKRNERFSYAIGETKPRLQTQRNRDGFLQQYCSYTEIYYWAKRGYLVLRRPI